MEKDECGVVRMLASHDGYTYLGVVHWRYMVVRSKGEILVMDYLVGDGEHLLDLNWHVEKEPVKEGGHYRLEENVLPNVKGGLVTLHSGESDPISGWKSPVYGVKKPAFTLNAKCTSKLPHEFITTVGISSMNDEQAMIEEERAFVKRWIK